MYIWTGADVNDQLETLCSVKHEAETALGLQDFKLPLHISLKMSFLVPDDQIDAVMECLTAYCYSLSPILVPVRGLEKENGIVWLRYGECPELSTMHDQLNVLMQDRFGIALHPYDSDFIFHTTLFMDQDNDKLAHAYEMVRSIPLPTTLRVSRCLIGMSPSGKPGDYRIVRTVDMNAAQVSDTVTLEPMTRHLCHALFMDWENDPSMYADPAQCPVYRYDADAVNRFFDKKQEPSRVMLAIMLQGKPIGALDLKHIDREAGECTLSIHLKNDSVKNRGYGTQAEILALRYAFNDLRLKTVFADAVSRNIRSQHVLKKAGFRFVEEKEGFRYYRCNRPENEDQ